MNILSVLVFFWQGCRLRLRRSQEERPFCSRRERERERFFESFAIFHRGDLSLLLLPILSLFPSVGRERIVPTHKEAFLFQKGNCLLRGNLTGSCCGGFKGVRIYATIESLESSSWSGQRQAWKFHPKKVLLAFSFSVHCVLSLPFLLNVHNFSVISLAFPLSIHIYVTSLITLPLRAHNILLR